MSWIAYLWLMRPRASIVFGGAILMLALIKLTSKLPEKYYFNFSSMVSSDSSPFIVDPPGVTYAKLCAIIQRNQQTDPKFAVESTCERANKATETKQPVTYGQQQADAIYHLVLQNDETMRSATEKAARDLIVPAVSPVDVDRALQTTQNMESASLVVEQSYSRPASDAAANSLAESFGSIFETLPDAAPAEEADGGPARIVGAAAKADLNAAVEATNAEIKGPLPNIKIKPITKQRLDDIVRAAFARDDLSRQVSSYYTDQVGAAYAALFHNKLNLRGVDPARDKKAIDGLMRAEAIPAYLMSATLRLLPVLIVGLLVGLVFGAGEISSAALAGAFAAFLLVWPVVLMWDRVVSFEWQDKRPIFFSLYLLYIFTFFMTARFSAGLGAMLNRVMPFKVTSESAADKGAENNLMMGVLRDLMVGLLVSAVHFVGNAFVTAA